MVITALSRMSVASPLPCVSKYEVEALQAAMLALDALVEFLRSARPGVVEKLSLWLANARCDGSAKRRFELHRIAFLGLLTVVECVQ
jgi:hypothetical protein